MGPKAYVPFVVLTSLARGTSVTLARSTGLAIARPGMEVTTPMMIESIFMLPVCLILRRVRECNKYCDMFVKVKSCGSV
jgi:hypothetical protein